MKRALNDFELLRAQELLVQRATEGLTNAEHDELITLGKEDVEGFDVAAAAVDLATLPREELPSALADKVFAAALEALGTTASTNTAPAVPAVAAMLTEPALPRVVRAPPAKPRTSRVPMLAGWATAAVAAAVAAGLWFTSARPEASVAPGAARTSFVATSDDEVTLPCSAGADPSAQAVTGDVVWSSRKQQGYVRLRGLPINDPARARYQVWIFDRDRDQRYPVDGGLFDAVADETIIELRPRVPVSHATEFLVTAEGPTGAVVSDRARVIAIAR